MRVRTFLSLLCGVRTTTTTTVVVRTLLWCGYSLEICHEEDTIFDLTEKIYYKQYYILPLE